VAHFRGSNLLRQTLASLLSVVCAAGLLAQSSAPGFEVASVRLAAIPGLSQRVTDSRIDLRMPLWSVLRMAFRAKEYQISGPPWLKEVRVDISATIPPNGTRSRVPEMLQQLLKERFDLATHTEVRSVEAYELRAAENQTKMRRVEAVNELDKVFLATPSPGDNVSDTPDGPQRMIPLPTGGYRIVTATSKYDVAVQRGKQVIEAARMSMPELAGRLEVNLDFPVVDRTNLDGVYQFRIELPRDATAMNRLRRMGITTRPDGDPIDPVGDLLSKSLRDLGLVLEKRRVSLDVVIIDKMERAPKEN
jgi:uncharacterized protein (TIGR03435 family)